MKCRIVVLASILASGCGGNAPPVDDSIAKAMTVESKQQKVMDEAKSRDREIRTEQAAQKKEQETRRAAELDAAAVMPATMPPDLATACEEVMNAHDAFMKRGAESDALAWSDGRRRKMGERRSACITQGSVEVAACQIQALAADPPSLADVERTEAARLLMARCSDKFGKT